MKRLFAFLALVLLTFAYLYPGSAAMVVGSNSEVMSDNTDISPLPLAFDNMARSFREDPKRFFFGAIYVDRFEPEQGSAMWMSLSARWLGLAFEQFMPSEQISTALVFVYLLLDAIAMFALAKTLKWNEWSALGLALAWAFSFYALARAQVHSDFTALYHLPLIFMALLLVARARGLLQLSLPAFLFLLAASVPHYYLLTATFLTPFFLLFFFLQPEVRGKRARAFGHLAVAALPVVLLMACNFIFPLAPADKAKISQILPDTGKTPEGMKFHPFLTYYAARPIDYLTGPIWPGSYDPNPWRAKWDAAVLDQTARDGREGNAHERTNGVRWSLWLLTFAAFTSLAFRAFAKPNFTEQEKTTTRMLWCFLALGLAGFALSLAPSTAYPAISPSYWLNQLVSQVRVPSRAGMYVAFSLLMIVGYWLNSTLAPRALRKLILLPAIFPLIILVEFPPLSRVQMAPVRNQIEALSTEHGACGAGLYFPFVYANEGTLDWYYFQQRLRGTDCQVLNALANPKRAAWLAARFPATNLYLQQLPGDAATRVELHRLARCVPLSWIVFDPHVSAKWAQGVCDELGWKLSADGSCVAPDHSLPLRRFPDDCG